MIYLAGGKAKKICRDKGTAGCNDARQLIDEECQDCTDNRYVNGTVVRASSVKEIRDCPLKCGG